MNTKKTHWKWWLAATALGLVAGCGSPEGGSTGPGLPNIDPDEPQPVPAVGQSSFVSADGRNGQATQDNADRGAGNNGAEAGAPSEDGADFDGSSDRSVEEGDIYRVHQDSGLILNLNAFRGLQIIDFSDPSAPEILGRVQVAGSPVEMYQVGDRVFVLMNNWRGYWGSRSDVNVNTFEGGLVMAIDVSDPHNPKVTGRATVPGWIRTSRLTRGDDKEALFVVANDWNTGQTYVKSFSVSGAGKLAEKSQIDLGGYITDIQASNQILMVARHDWNRNGGSDVSLIDISDPNGTMVEGDDIHVKGFVQKKTNMDHTGDIVRIVSGNNWSTSTNTNYVQTFDITNLDAAQPVDEETFGDGENLFATLFLDDKAFFVTYRRVDPFHAFSIDETGQIEEKSEFIVSGWNDFFKPVSANSRLIGIGKNDQNGVTLAVSLYDIEDLTNPSPMVAREEIDLRWSWSEANWDDRAFSVLEKGTNVLAPTGELETGLVLLPFSGWDDTADRYVSGVQIFTFSDDTLTKRGIMTQDTQVRRSFVADRDDNITGNLSEQELSLFDTTDPDQPLELSRLELAPNYTNFFVFGNYGLRRHDNSGYWGWWGYNSNIDRTDTLQIVSLADNVDDAPALAEIEVPANAALYRVGEKLVAVTAEYLNTQDANGYPEYETTLQVWDLTDPANPALGGTLITQDLPVTGYYDYWGWEDCWECDVAGYYYGPVSANAYSVDNGLVFLKANPKQELEGTETITYSYPNNNNRWDNCYDHVTYEPKECTYLSGGITCRQLDRVDGTEEAEVCTGKYHLCTQDDTGETDCQETTPSPSEIYTNSYTHERYRYWQHYDLHVVDLTNAGAPQLGTVFRSATDDEGVSVLARGDKVYMTYKRPLTLPGDTRPYVRYYFRTIDYSNPSSPTHAPGVNIPGELLEVDGNTVVTRDFLWGQNIVETSINKLEVANNTAYLKGVNRFTDKQVGTVLLDGAGHVLVTHSTAWLVNYEEAYYDWEDWDRTLRLAILDLASPTFDKLSETEIDDWANLQGAISGRALFTVPGGVLVVNIDDATQPKAQSYFALRGWPQSVDTKGREVYFAAGPFGLYTFDLDEYNLLQP